MKTNLTLMAVAGLLALALPGFAASWNNLTPLPGDGYFDASLVYASGYLYQAGGINSDNGLLDVTNVLYAQVQNDGTIGSWNATTSLPEPVFDHAGVAADGFLYVLGGDHYNSANGLYISSNVYYVKINSDASLGSWQTANPLPDSLLLLSASVWNNRIYVIGGNNGNNFQNTVYSAAIQTNGSLSAWTTQTSLPVETCAQAEAANGFLYVLGGAFTGTEGVCLNTVYYTKINADGTLAGWNQTAFLPQSESDFGAVAANGWVFSIGGWNGSEPTASFYGAVVNGDGSPGSWSVGTALPQPLQQFAVAASGSYIFVSGGENNYENSSAVYSMALPPPPVTPTLVSGGFTNGNFQFQLASSTNTGFGLLASTNLTTWSNAGWGFTGTNGLLNFQDTNAANFPERFYRAYWPLP